LGADCDRISALEFEPGNPSSAPSPARCRVLSRRCLFSWAVPATTKALRCVSAWISRLNRVMLVD